MFSFPSTGIYKIKDYPFRVQSESREYLNTKIISNLVLNMLVCLMEFQFSSLISSLKPRMIVSNICSIKSGNMGINAAGAVLQKAIKGKRVFICDVRPVVMMNR